MSSELTVQMQLQLQVCFKADKRQVSVPAQWSIEQLRLHLADEFGLADTVKLIGLPASVRVVGDVSDNKEKKKKIPRVVLIGCTHQERESVQVANAALNAKQPKVAPSFLSDATWTKAREMQQGLAEEPHEEARKENARHLSYYSSSRFLYGDMNPTAPVNQASRALASNNIAGLRNITNNSVLDASFTSWMETVAVELACRTDSCDAIRLLESKVALSLRMVAGGGWNDEDEENDEDDNGEEAKGDVMPITISTYNLPKAPLLLAIELGFVDTVRYLVRECEQEGVRNYMRRKLHTWLLPMSVATLQPEITDLLLDACRTMSLPLQPKDWERCAAIAAAWGDSHAFFRLFECECAPKDSPELIVRALEEGVRNWRLDFLQLVLPELQIDPSVWFKPLFHLCVAQAWDEGLVWMRGLLPDGLFPWEAHSEMAAQFDASEQEVDRLIVLLIDDGPSHRDYSRNSVIACLDLFFRTGLEPSQAWRQQMRAWVEAPGQLAAAQVRSIVRLQVLMWRREEDDAQAHALVTFLNRGQQGAPVAHGISPLSDHASALPEQEYPDIPFPSALVEMVVDYTCGTTGHKLPAMHARHMRWFGADWKVWIARDNKALFEVKQAEALAHWEQNLQRMGAFAVSLAEKNIDQQRQEFVSAYMQRHFGLNGLISYCCSAHESRH